MSLRRAQTQFSRFYVEAEQLPMSVRQDVMAPLDAPPRLQPQRCSLLFVCLSGVICCGLCATIGLALALPLLERTAESWAAARVEQRGAAAAEIDFWRPFAAVHDAPSARAAFPRWFEDGADPKDALAQLAVAIAALARAQARGAAVPLGEAPA